MLTTKNAKGVPLSGGSSWKGKGMFIPYILKIMVGIERMTAMPARNRIIRLRLLFMIEA